MNILKNLLGNQSKIHVDEIAVVAGLLLGDAVIVESGSNANGDYVKLGNGWMICFQFKNVNIAIATTEGSARVSDVMNWIYPMSFMDRPVVLTGIHTSSSIPFTSITKNIGTSSVGIQFMYIGSTPYSPFTNSSARFAIGRWKP